MGVRSDRDVVAAVAGHPLLPNMEAELRTLGEVLEGSFECHLVIGDQPSDPLQQTFDLIYRVQPPVLDYRGVRYALRAAHSYLNEHTPNVLLNIAQQMPVGLAVVMAGRQDASVQTVLRIAGEPFRLHELETTTLGRVQKWLVHRVGIGAAGRWADAVLTLGPRLRAQLVEGGMPPETVHALPTLFDARRFRPPAGGTEDLKDELGLDPSRRTVLFVGRLLELKGADRLLEVIRNVLQHTDDIQFCLVGEGPLLSEFQTIPSPGVRLAGTVPYEDMPAYYRVADLLVHPSRTEGLPNVILEAIAAGVPVIAAPVGEIPRYVPATATHPEEYVEYILDGDWEVPARPNWFTFDVLRERYLSFFHQLVSTKRRGV